MAVKPRKPSITTHTETEMTYTERDFEIMQAIHDDAQKQARQRIADFVKHRKWNQAVIDVEFMREELTAWARRGQA
jgi:hypothetical protein